MEEWFAFFASPSTPAPMVAQLNRRLRSVIEDRELVEVLKPLGLEVETTSSDELTALIDTHRRDWQARMEATGIKAAAAVK
jgi:tripartite-type tricarboxylate transporter receptor subunit TctC